MARILIVEDDQEIADQVRRFLLYDSHNLDVLNDGADAVSQLKVAEYDLIILDWQLPGLEGIEVCRQLRKMGSGTPVLMLTGKTTVADKEAGLDTGADDYLTKPFDLKELGARVRALLRRPARLADKTINAARLTIDAGRHRAVKDGQPIALQPKEFQLLEFFMRHPNRVFSPEALLDRIWPADSEVSISAIRTTLKRLRQKIDPEQEILKTVHGVGYILETPE